MCRPTTHTHTHTQSLPYTGILAAVKQGGARVGEVDRQREKAKQA